MGENHQAYIEQVIIFQPCIVRVSLVGLALKIFLLTYSYKSLPSPISCHWSLSRPPENIRESELF